METISRALASFLALRREYGTFAFVFVLAIVVVLVVGGAIGSATLLGQGPFASSDSPTAIAPEPPFDPGPEIRRSLANIRDELRGDDPDIAVLVELVEWFRPDGQSQERGFDADGTGVVRFISKTPGVPDCAIFLNTRFPAANPGIDPFNVSARRTELVERDGFVAIPDTTFTKTNAPAITCFVGDSYYLIAGYDENHRMVVTVSIAFYTPGFNPDEPKLDFVLRALSVDDLRISMRDVVAIVDLLE